MDSQTDESLTGLATKFYRIALEEWSDMTQATRHDMSRRAGCDSDYELIAHMAIERAKAFLSRIKRFSEASGEAPSPASQTYGGWTPCPTCGKPTTNRGATPVGLPFVKPLAQERKFCSWTEDDEGNWDTSCGEKFVFETGGPVDNGMKFCCYCSGHLQQVTTSRSQAEDEKPMWMTHRPGNPMPCDPGLEVLVIFHTGIQCSSPRPAAEWYWGEETTGSTTIIGWRPASRAEISTAGEDGAAQDERIGWFHHTPGSPRPCEKEDFVDYILRDGSRYGPCTAKLIDWGAKGLDREFEVLMWRPSRSKKK